MTGVWTMHVPAERQGAAQRCGVCGYVLQDVSPPAGLVVPPAEVEAIAQEVPWWTVGGQVAVRGDAAVDLASVLEGNELDWQACTAAAP